MGLFGKPSRELLDGYRANLQVVTYIDESLLQSHHTQSLWFKAERYQFTVTTESVDSVASGWFPVVNEWVPPVALGTALCTDDYSGFIVKSPKPVNLDAQSPSPCLEEIGFEPPNWLNWRKASRLSVTDPHLAIKTAALETEDIVAKEIDLISAPDLQSREVELDCDRVLIVRFSYPPPRQDPKTTLFGPERAQRITGIRVAPIVPPEAPPTLNKVDLQERLRILLTPPIHEVLSDPQLALPEKPFPYQTIGIQWLRDRETALLADEMGLGKTMQAIIAARLLWRDGIVKHILIVCPKPLIPNWRNELRTWWPGIDWHTKVVEGDREWNLRLATKDIAVKIINYESLRRELTWLKEKPPYHDLVIIDEAQRIKNPGSDNSQAVKALKANRRWALTGTPLENSKADLVSICDFVRPGLVKESDSEIRIRSSVKPYVLRRRKEEVLKDLPSKREQDIEIELGDLQREAYDRAERKGIIELNEKGDTITVTHVFALITRLRQICNFEQTSGESAKSDLLLEDLEEILESGRKALIFCQFVDEPYGLKRLVRKLTESKKLKPGTRFLEFHGKTPAKSREGIVNQFQNDPDHQLLFLNYRVGGEGLNLQAASYVFLFDRWWNPAVEDQAIGRCHRLGQKQTVFVKRPFCKGTVEERIIKKLAEKRRLFNRMVDEDRMDEESISAALGLTEEEIFSLFNLTVRPRRPSRPTGPVQIVLDNLDDKEFEQLVALVYEKIGYQVTVTGGSHDGGIDIVAERGSGGGKDRVVVQCKHQKQNVGRPVLQQLWGVLNSDSSLTRCDVVTSAGFTSEALGFAMGKRLTLIDRSELEQLALKHGVARFVTL
jgi:superfamily II DNA or RNA helicase